MSSKDFYLWTLRAARAIRGPRLRICQYVTLRLCILASLSVLLVGLSFSGWQILYALGQSSLFVPFAIFGAAHFILFFKVLFTSHFNSESVLPSTSSRSIILVSCP